MTTLIHWIAHIILGNCECVDEIHDVEKLNMVAYSYHKIPADTPSVATLYQLTLEPAEEESDTAHE